MKKGKIIIFVSIFVLVLAVFLVGFFLKNREKDLSKELTKTKTVTIEKIFGENQVEEKKITDSSDIDELINIIQKRTEIPEDEDITYRELPNYRLKFLDKKDKVIAEVDFYYYSDESSWISVKDDEYYKIDSGKLLKILETIYEE